MTVFLGTFGEVELQRQFEADPIFVTLKPADVNAAKKRFSVRFSQQKAFGPDVLLTGDQIQIKRTDGNALDFITGNTKPGVKKFIHVDQVGGIRLYNTFSQAVTGDSGNAVSLSTPASSYEVRIRVEQRDFRTLAQVTSYELNTERETVDTTALSDEFRNRVSSLMSGSGRMTCEWNYTGNTSNELANYLLELALRAQVGSAFNGRFYLKQAGYNPSGVSDRNNDSVWYEVKGVLTACAVSFAVGSIVQMTADFVTTGEIELKTNIETPFQLLLEDGDKLLGEEDDEMSQED